MTLPAQRPSQEAPWQLDLPCPFPYLLSLFLGEWELLLEHLHPNAPSQEPPLW